MSGYLHWLVLNDGVAERVTGNDIDAAEEARVIDRGLLPLILGETGAAGGRDSGFTVEGVIASKRALLRLLDGGVPVADVAVCLHARAAPGLWREIVGDDAALVVTTDIKPPPVPWCAVCCYVPEFALPAWFDQWTKTVAMALVRREGW